jgi:hypothetical protein
MGPVLSALAGASLVLMFTISPTFGNEVLRTDVTLCDPPDPRNPREDHCRNQAILFIDASSEFYNCSAYFSGLYSNDKPPTPIKSELKASCQPWVRAFIANGGYVGGVGEITKRRGSRILVAPFPLFAWAFTRSGKQGRACYQDLKFGTTCVDVEFK